MFGPALGMEWIVWTILVIVFFWMTYLALEPIVRRRWPQTLVSWTRLLRGRFLDPLVGRDVLLGVLGGVVLAILSQAYYFADDVRWPATPEQLAGGWYALADRVVDCGLGVLNAILPLMLLALFRQLLSRTWAAMIAVVLVYLPLTTLGASSLPVATISVLLIIVHFCLLIRPGLLAAVIARSVSEFLADTLMTTHLGAWYAASAISGILATLAVAAWGFYAALGGRPLFGDPGREAA